MTDRHPGVILRGAAVRRPGVADGRATEAVGVRAGRVEAVGTLREVRDAMGPGVTEELLDGGVVLPAFLDAHQHAFLVAVDPHTDALHRRADDLPALLRLVGDLMSAEPAGTGWLRFHGYHPLALRERRSPTATELDRVCADRPVHVLARTYHESAVNSAGLDALGIGRGTPDPPGGRILRDRRGRPTGVLLESASFAAEASSRPSLGDEAWRARLAAYGRRLLAHGIARIGDAAVPAGVAAAVVDVLDDVGVSVHPLLVGERIDEPVFVHGGVGKVLADGGEYCDLCMTNRQMGAVVRASARAALGPERDVSQALARRSGTPRREPGGRWRTGVRYPPIERLPAVLGDAADVGAGVAVHAVGNGAVASLLDALEADPGLAAAVPLRIEHAMVLDHKLIDRLGRCSATVVAQPSFLTEYGHELTVVPVPDPLALMPFRRLLDAGVALAFSSDHPAVDLSPWSGLQAAVTRHDDRGTPIHPAESISLAEAFDAYTRVSGAAVGVPGAGTIAKGAPADLQWYAADPLAGDGVSRPAERRPQIVWRAGLRVHEAGTG